MKYKNSMTKLRNKIVWYFALITFVVAVTESALDSTFADVIYPRFYAAAGNGMRWNLLEITYLAVSILLYVLGGIVFYRVVKKAVYQESMRQMNEQNLIYAAMAHDLKTPMTSVQGFAKALAEGKIPEEENTEIYDIIYRKSCSMNEMIHTLFDYAKLGMDEYKPAFEKTDICVLVRDLAAEQYCDFEQHGTLPEIDIPDEPIFVNADRQELGRALSNLMINAYKHNPDGIRVYIGVKEENGKGVVVVADTGNEISADMGVFEPFVTENSARTAGGGSGLGLAITKRIIERHGGSIEMTKQICGYTKAFVVRL